MPHQPAAMRRAKGVAKSRKIPVQILRKQIPHRDFSPQKQQLSIDTFLCKSSKFCQEPLTVAIHARIPACLYRSVIPQADLYLADMGLAQQQHAQAALANAAAHCQGQGAIQQQFVEGQLRALRAACGVQLAAQGVGVNADTHTGQLQRAVQRLVPERMSQFSVQSS